MRKVILYSILLLVGLSLSQALPSLIGDSYDPIAVAVRVLTMVCLAFIMIRVGFEFHIDKSRLGSYGWDYLVAFTAASVPWILVSAYFVFVMLPEEVWANFAAWKETLLAGRFAAPTSAGVLFNMLAAAGLGTTWLFRKARTLAIFDDLDTVLLMIPLKMLMVGLAWQLGMVVLVMASMLAAGYIWLHRIRIPVTWPWVLGYATVIVGISELLHVGSKMFDPSVPIHIEILLPAFVLGCMAKPGNADAAAGPKTLERAFHEITEHPSQRPAITAVSAAFMVFVGLSMPAIFEGADAQHPAPNPASLHAAAPASIVDDPTLHGGQVSGRYVATVTARQPNMGWPLIALHVLLITLLSNLGKMLPTFFYRKEAHWRHRLAVSICMWPRGEVGAGILVLSLSYGIGGPIVTVAMLSLSLNLALTGFFILLVKKLIENTPEAQGDSVA